MVLNQLSKLLPAIPFKWKIFVPFYDTSLTFPDSVSNQLKVILSSGEAQFKSFLNDRLIQQRVPLTQKISLNKFQLLGSKETAPSLDLSATFMNKLRRAVKHRPEKAAEFFDGELYGIYLLAFQRTTQIVYIMV